MSSHDVFQEIYAVLTPEYVLPQLGVTLKREGSEYVGLCPKGHDSKSKTSFQYNPDKKCFNCWNCGFKGSVIDLLVYVKLGSDPQKGMTPHKKQIFAQIANDFNISFDLNPVLEQRYNLYELLEDAKQCFNSQLSDEHYIYLEDKLGISRKDIDQEGIGYWGDITPLTEKYSQDALKEAGLLVEGKNGIRQFAQHRYTYPINQHGRISSFTFRASSQSTWFNGEPPKYIKLPIRSEKHPYISDQLQQPLWYHANNEEDLISTEGYGDFVSLKYSGFNVISPGSTQIKETHIKEFVDICKRHDDVYICNDSEKSEAGWKATKKLSVTMIEQGINPRVIRLPLEDNQDKIDACEFLKTKGKDAFEQLKSEAPTYIDYLIQDIPIKTDTQRLLKTIDPILSLISCLSEGQIEIYTRLFKERFKLSGLKEVQKSIKSTIKDYQAKKNGKNRGEDDIFNKSNSNIKFLNSGQCFSDKKLYYTITHTELAKNAENELVPFDQLYVVDSDRQIYKVSDRLKISENLLFERRIPSAYKADSWTFSDASFSIEDFVNNQCEVDPAKLFIEIRSMYKKFVYFVHDEMADLLSVAMMSSYVISLFYSCGYIHILAHKQSGKTLCMTLASNIGYNATLTSSISEAALFRIIELQQPLVLMDEAENLNPSAKQREYTASELMEMLKSGYKSNVYIIRCEGKEHTPVRYRVYGLKIFAGTKPVNHVLEDRVIVTELRKVDRDLELDEFIESEYDSLFQDIRNKCHVFGLSFAREIHDIYRSFGQHQVILKQHDVVHREKEIWTNYLCIALLIDKYNPELNVFKRLLGYAKQTIKTKKNFAKDSKNLLVLECLYLWVKDRDDHHQTYGRFTNSDMRDFLTHLTESYPGEYETYKLNYIYEKLRFYHAIDADYKINFKRDGKSHRGVYLNKITLLESLKTYKSDLCEEVSTDLGIIDDSKLNEIMAMDDGDEEIDLDNPWKYL